MHPGDFSTRRLPRLKSSLRAIDREVAQKRTTTRSDLTPEPTFIGLEMLFRAHRYANETNSDIWDFAVEIEDLEEAGLSKSDFRWLLAHQYAEHAEEITLPNSPIRQFKPLPRHHFTEATCFVLSEKGLDFLQGSDLQSSEQTAATAKRPGDDHSNEDSTANVPKQNGKPIWDSQGKELWFGDVIIKRFRWPARNQELLLEVFEEEGWPRRIDDPLPKMPEQDPRRRLHDTIKCLNRNQENQLIRFHGDGTGEGVIWELVE